MALKRKPRNKPAWIPRNTTKTVPTTNKMDSGSENGELLVVFFVQFFT